MATATMAGARCARFRRGSNSVEQQIRRLDRRDVIRDDSADRLRDDAQRIENRLHRAARNGLNPYEANDIQARIANLEQRVRYAVSYSNRRHGDRVDRRTTTKCWSMRRRRGAIRGAFSVGRPFCPLQSGWL